MAEPENRTLPSDPLPSQLRVSYLARQGTWWRFYWRKPIRVRTAGRFHAADPWNGNAATEFSIEVYWPSDALTFLPASGIPAGSHFLDMFGIRSEIENSYCGVSWPNSGKP